MPTQTKSAHYTVLVPQIFSEKKDLQGYTDLKETEKKWRIDNNLFKKKFSECLQFKKISAKKSNRNNLR